MIYFSLVHSFLLYDIIFWGTSSYIEVIFKIHKRIIIVNMNSDTKNSCCEVFKKLYILPLHSQNTFSILLLVDNNRGLFKSNSDVHNSSTRSNYDLHRPTAKWTIFQKRVCFSGINIYNHLPFTLKQLSYDIWDVKTYRLVNRDVSD
jgi:hypothetical protein